MSAPHLARDLGPLQPYLGWPRRALYLANRRTFATAFRRALCIAHGERCTYCGDPITVRQMHVDHVIPLSRGGLCATENLAAACVTCNSGKCERDLEEFRWCLAVRLSAIYGVVSAAQALSLVELGVELPVARIKFHFEECLESRP